jgi:hypothetical protein
MKLVITAFACLAILGGTALAQEASEGGRPAGHPNASNRNLDNTAPVTTTIHHRRHHRHHHVVVTKKPE